MVEKEIRVHTVDGEMTTFVVRPAGDGPFPVAVIFMDGVGYREQVKKNARRFAAAGYFCVAPDLYYRAGEKLSFDMSGMLTGGLKGPEAERMMKADILSVVDELPPREREIIRMRAGLDSNAEGMTLEKIGEKLGIRMAAFTDFRFGSNAAF